MITRIYKYSVPVKDEPTDIDIPTPYNVVHVGFQENGSRLVVFWVRFDPSSPKETHRFTIHGTGQDILDTEHYIGTAQSITLQLVWHLFEVIK